MLEFQTFYLENCNKMQLSQISNMAAIHELMIKVRLKWIKSKHQVILDMKIELVYYCRTLFTTHLKYVFMMMSYDHGGTKGNVKV